MSRAKTENEAVVIPLGLECFRRAPASHHPIVMGFLWVIRPEVFFGYMREDAQGFRLAAFDELHARVIFPGPERIFGRLWRILVLLSNERAGISDQASKQIGPKPAHRQCRSTTGAATHNRSTPRIVRNRNVREGRLYLWVVQNRRHDFVVDESGKAIGQESKALPSFYRQSCPRASACTPGTPPHPKNPTALHSSLVL